MDILFLEKQLIGTEVDKPISGAMAGHAAGEPFDKHVEDLLKERSDNVYRQYEYLNSLYQSNLTHKTVVERHSLINKKSVGFLLNRGKDTTKEWSSSNIFEEKQNDTADILIEEDGFFQILDVKTRNLGKKAQAPNIISALKLAEVCKIMLETNEFNAFDITYIGIEWELSGSKLVCKNAYIKELFKCPPENLYINWSAALQIQFHVDQLSQAYEGNMKEWAIQYLRHFVSKAKTRIRKMETDWIDKYDITQD